MPNPPDAPPCVKIGEPMNWCARAVFGERVLGNITLFDAWAKWRFVGADLVSPDGFKISAHRLQSLLLTEGRAAAVRVQKNAGQPDNVLRFDASRSRDLDKMPSKSPG